jgi:hypothetical protein
MRSRIQSDGLSFGHWLVILAGVVVVVGGTTLAIYGSKVRPAQHNVEQVVPNDRFPS